VWGLGHATVQAYSHSHSHTNSRLTFTLNLAPGPEMLSGACTATLIADHDFESPLCPGPTVKPQSRRHATQPKGNHGQRTSSRWEELPSTLLRVSCYAPYSVQYQSEAPTTDRFVEVVGLCFKLWLRARSCSGRPFPQSLVELSLPCRKEHSGRPCPRNSKRPVGMNSSCD
jgi:hypothetical protein